MRTVFALLASLRIAPVSVIAASLRSRQTKTGKRICARLKSKRTGKRNRVRIMALTDDALFESDLKGLQ